jgi:hypothetical protein
MLFLIFNHSHITWFIFFNIILRKLTKQKVIFMYKDRLFFMLIPYEIRFPVFFKINCFEKRKPLLVNKFIGLILYNCFK